METFKLCFLLKQLFRLFQLFFQSIIDKNKFLMKQLKIY
jgi:hypothetical protein